jgi:hypothetical protein
MTENNMNLNKEIAQVCPIQEFKEDDVDELIIYDEQRILNEKDEDELAQYKPIKNKFQLALTLHKTISKESCDNDVVNAYTKIVNPNYIRNQLTLLEMQNVTLEQYNFKKSNDKLEVILTRELTNLVQRYHHPLLDDFVWEIEQTNKNIKFTNTTQECNMSIIVNHLRLIIKLFNQRFPDVKIKKDYDNISSCWRHLVHLIITI